MAEVNRAVSGIGGRRFTPWGYGQASAGRSAVDVNEM